MGSKPGQAPAFVCVHGAHLCSHLPHKCMSRLELVRAQPLLSCFCNPYMLARWLCPGQW